jgi:hypothetical protein
MQKTAIISSIPVRARAIALVVAGILALAGLAASQAQAARPHSPAASVCPGNQVELPTQAVHGGPDNGEVYCIPRRSSGDGSRIVPLYSQVATKILRLYNRLTGAQAHRKALVVCWSGRDWRAISQIMRGNGEGGLNRVLAYVYPDWNLVNLSPGVCRKLDALIRGAKRVVNYRLAETIITLAHETIHVAGVGNESRAECHGMQLTALTAGALGLGKGYGRKLAQLALSLYEDNYGGTEYYTPKCKNGSPLDLFPGAPRFP